MTRNNVRALPTSEIAEDFPPDWLEAVAPGAARRLMDADNLDIPLLQLPLAQMRLAQALFDSGEMGEPMGRLSTRLGVRQNALTQAADRLVCRGVAERFADKSDRRVVRLRLTEIGLQWVAERRARRQQHYVKLWRLLDTTERDQLLMAIRFLEKVANRLDQEQNSSGISALHAACAAGREASEEGK